MKGFVVLLIGISVFLFDKTALAQQDAMYSMYMFNGLAINPAYAGSRETLSLTALYRHQWTGFEGAPKTAVLVGHSPLLNDKIGLGLSVTSDNISIFNMMHISASYAYRIKIRKGKLALGMSVTMSNYRARWSDVTLNNNNDQAFASNSDNVTNPNFGYGIYYYSDKLYVGVSVPHILNNGLSEDFTVEGTDLTARQYKHYFYTVGAIFRVTDNVKFKPSLLFKHVKNSPFQADLNVSFLMNEALWLGASYRTGDAVSFMIEYMFVKSLRVGYAYDLTLTELNDYSSGTHEIMLGYEFLKKDTYLTPRRMSYF